MITDKSVLEHIAAQDAHVVMGTKTCAAYVRGDRRRRPVFYVERAQAVRLLKGGYLSAEGGEVLRLAPDYKRPRYVPPPIEKPRRAPLEALRKSKAGRAPYLTAREARAGERYAADCMRANQGGTAQQRYDSSGVFTAKSSAGQEGAMAARIDAHNRLRDARTYAGPQLTKILNAVLAQDMTLAGCEAQNGWTRGSARAVFKKALGELAAHYKEIALN